MTERISYDGVMAARIDRLPLTRVQWQLAILVETTWGFIIFDTDGIGARLYPFVWRPAHVIDVLQYAVIQALQVGLGILLGVYIMSWVADRYGRRPAILLATFLGGICIWPFAYVTNFAGMVVLSVLSTLGVGGIVATHSVYLSEMTSPEVRNRVLLTSQGVTALVAVGVNLLAFAWIPGQWRLFLWVSALVEMVVLLPLLWRYLPESPRWLEAHGRHAEAERIMGRYEKRCAAASGAPLPPPKLLLDRVIGAEGGSWTELFVNPAYRGRTWLLIAVWLLAYAGLIYGVGAFAAVFMVDHGGGAHFVFLTIAIAYAALFVGFLVNARLGEQVERRDVLFAMGLLFAAAWVVAWLVPNLWVIGAAYIVSRIGTGLFLFNLYNYTAVAYPTRIRSMAFAWTDGLGHLGAWAGVTLLGPLYTLGPNHLGWVLWIVVPGSLLPALLIRYGGIRQSRAVLEQISV
ncbi:MAG TPA: MFS transporter [Rhodopila sp.]|uniref:MFS transporter n=1 Tax=Rhodopila sp. TaxID=2480087 RepID=UPI002B8A8570|nr:MFS transporter [Rhodopila sp.]HVY17168.1 MFS transporter [Rhodopila sp.]